MKLNGPINLKRASVSDIPALLEIEKSVAGTKIYSPMLESGEWEEELQRSEVYLIEKNDEAVGDISYEHKGANHVYISGLVIQPSFQGQGIARKVLTDLLKKLKDIKRVDLVTHPDNHAALNLYRSLGFVIEGRKENYYGDGEPRLVLTLSRHG